MGLNVDLIHAKSIETEKIADNAVCSDFINSEADQFLALSVAGASSFAFVPNSLSQSEIDVSYSAGTWVLVGSQPWLQETERANGFCRVRVMCPGNGTTYWTLVACARRRSDQVIIPLQIDEAQLSVSGAKTDLFVEFAIDGLKYDRQWFVVRSEINYDIRIKAFTSHQRVMKK
jgi:hypothetical protein